MLRFVLLFAMFVCAPDAAQPAFNVARWANERNMRLNATPWLNPERFEAEQRERIVNCPARADLDPPRGLPPHPRPESIQKAKVVPDPVSPPIAAVDAVIRSNRGRVDTCVWNAFLQDPCTAGRIGVSWSIVAGKVHDVQLTQNTTGNDELGGCVTKAVRSMRFDPAFTGMVDEYAWVVGGE